MVLAAKLHASMLTVLCVTAESDMRGNALTFDRRYLCRLVETC